MLSIDVIPTYVYVDPGDEWVRYQSARIQQKHLQVGRHFRLDLTGLLRRLAVSTRATRLNEALEPWRLTSADHRRPVATKPLTASAAGWRCVPGPATLGEFLLCDDDLNDRICDHWLATLADYTEVVVSDFRGAPSRVGIEKAVSVVQSLGYLKPRALQLLVPFTKEAGTWRLVTLDFGAEARRHECEFLMCFAFQAPNSQLAITSAYIEIGFALLRSEVSEPLFSLTVKSASGLLN